MEIITMSILIVLIAVVGWFVGIFNKLIGFKNQVEQSWADIDVELKRRYDLIPNLVETVKGYAAHEQGTFEKVIQARNTAMSAKTMAAKEEAENQLTGALKSIFALAENYPQLRAVETFTKLQSELSDTENKIQSARRFYNTSVRDLNTATQMFPSSLVASMTGIGKKEFFQAAEGDKAVPQVKF